MTSCETCDAGWTPNPEKTACGKITFIIAVLKLIVLYNSNKYKLYRVFETRVSDVLVMFDTRTKSIDSTAETVKLSLIIVSHNDRTQLISSA